MRETVPRERVFLPLSSGGLGERGCPRGTSAGRGGMSYTRVHGTVKVSSSLIRLVVGRGRAGDGRWLQRMITTHDRNMLRSVVLSSVRRHDTPSAARPRVGRVVTSRVEWR